MKMLSEVTENSKITKKQRASIVGMHDKNIRNNVSVKSSSLHSKGFLASAPRQQGSAVVCKHLLCLPHTNSKQTYRYNNVRVIQRICCSAEKRNAKTKKNVNAYKRLEVVAYRGEGKRNKRIVTLTEYNADDVEMLAKKSVTGGIHDQKYYRVRLEFYRCFSLELVSRRGR